MVGFTSPPAVDTRGIDDRDADPGPPPRLLSDLSIVCCCCWCCCNEEDDAVTGDPEQQLLPFEFEVAVVPLPLLTPLLANEFVLDVGVCRDDSVANC